MPTLDSTGLGTFEIPTTTLTQITQRVQDQSVLATLSPEQPTLFGNVQSVRMSRTPRAQIVAEGAQKASDEAGWTSMTASPVKFQTTVRMTQEVKWLDEDHRLGIVDQLVGAVGDSMARAVDLIGIHGINPFTGTRATSITSYLNATTNRVVAAAGTSADPTGEVEGGVAAIAGEGKFVPTGVALAPAYAFSLATQRDNAGQRLNPDMGYGFNTGSYNGLSVARSSTVTGQPEAADTNLRALVGDFTQVKWGFQRRIPVELIEYGDPDGGGDLKNTNEIAYRAEGVIYVAIFDLDAFAAVAAAA